MSTTGDDAVLSDVEDETPVPIELTSTSHQDDKFQKLLADLNRERQSRQALEASNSDLQTSFNRLKLIAHDSIKKRDESDRLKHEALKAHDQLKNELIEVIRHRDEVFKEFNMKCDEAIKSKESLKSEVEIAAEMMLSGIETVSDRVKGIKEFRVGGLPRSDKFSGLGGVVYGVITRMSEIVEEIIREVEMRGKERDEARELMDQRSFESVIEVSELEARIRRLKEVVLDYEKLLIEKDSRLGLTEKEVERLGMRFRESEDKVESLERKMELQRALVVDQLNYVAKIHDQIGNVVKMVDVDRLDQLEVSESLFLPKGSDVEENLRACLEGMVSIYGLSGIVVEKTKVLVEERSNEVKHTVEELRRETSLLKQQAEAQEEELIRKKQKVEELEEKEKIANENVEGLMMDIAAAEEEITRWKVAAQEEAYAGKAVEHDFLSQLLAVRQELEEAKQAIIELENKLKYKEETADAAMAARDAAEKSLSLADLRSSKLRDKVEELTRQLEMQETSRSVLSRSRYLCWPWEWLRLNFVGFPQLDTHQERSNEMELSESLL
ncbi:hypothetical protein AgCh_019437 [Apium graveolens]